MEWGGEGVGEGEEGSTVELKKTHAGLPLISVLAATATGPVHTGSAQLPPLPSRDPALEHPEPGQGYWSWSPGCAWSWGLMFRLARRTTGEGTQRCLVNTP